MRVGCAISLGLVLIATVILYIFANPIGWFLAGLFILAAIVITVVRMVQLRRMEVPSRWVKHGEEDRQRGPSDDPMLH